MVEKQVIFIYPVQVFQYITVYQTIIDFHSREEIKTTAHDLQISLSHFVLSLLD